MNIEEINEDELRIYGENDEYKININVKKKIFKYVYDYFSVVSYYDGIIEKDNLIIDFKNILGIYIKT